MSYTLNKYQLIVIADGTVTRTLYNNVFEKDSLVILKDYDEVEESFSQKIPIIVDPIFREYCPRCKELMPPGKPPLKCHCGEMVRLGYIPMYNLPKVKFGYIFAPAELPKKASKALRAKGWRVVKLDEAIDIFSLRSFIVDYIKEKEVVRRRNLSSKKAEDKKEISNKSGEASL